jgi:hypothetical protein
MIREPRYYLSDDCDIEENKLKIYQAENGDWYVVILKPDERVGTAVRITTSGARRGCFDVAPALYKLYESLPEDNEDENAK